MTKPVFRRETRGTQMPLLGTRPLIFDYFAGGGGASEGVRLALGRGPDVAINHCAAAVAMHMRNHPATQHLHTDVWDVDPRRDLPAGDVDFVWMSPDCRHFSSAKGKAPLSKRVRGLAWITLRVAARRRPRVIALENVQEFRTWGPLGRGRRPIVAKRGHTFARFVLQLEELGYVVEHRVLNAAEYGAPTLRRRLVLIARCDGHPIVWPEPTHGPGRIPFRTAAECIDWTIPCPSIFGRKKPLAEATHRRIAEGIRRFVLTNPRPFIVRSNDATIAPTLIQTGYGERKGQTPRALDIQAPLGTVVACGAKHAVVSAWLIKHYGGVFGHEPDRPIGTITAKDHGVVACKLEPLGARVGNGDLVAAFLTRYNGVGFGAPVTEPLGTVTTRDRFGLVTITIDGEEWAIVDIGLRMLQPRELARCQGFGVDYVLTGTQAEQVARVGNSVCPQLAEAVVRSNFPVRRAEAAE